MPPETTATSVRAATPLIRKHWTELSDLNWPLVFLLYTVGAALSAGSVYTSELAQRSYMPYVYPAIWEFTGHYAMFALLPLIVLGFSRLPIRRDNWAWAIPVHLLLSMCFGVVHTLLMLYSREAIYWLFDLGRYDYGQMRYRFLMEYHKQFLHYCVVYAVLRFLAYRRQARERQEQAARMEIRAAELEARLAQTQLQALRSQLNPHFLFNTLNMVSSVMYEDADRADRMISCLSRMLRLSLEENPGDKVRLSRELEFVNCATELAQARFGDSLRIEVQAGPGTQDLLVPKLLVYTFIENAIKHRDTEDAGPLVVRCTVVQSGNELRLVVEDNGPGIADLQRAMQSGVGLSNARQRLVALYGSAHRFDLRNRPGGGLEVFVSIPAERAGVSAPEPALALS